MFNSPYNLLYIKNYIDIYVILLKHVLNNLFLKEQNNGADKFFYLLRRYAGIIVNMIT